MQTEKSSGVIDDRSISDDMALWRLVGPNFEVNGQPKIYIIRDERHGGRWRPSSLAFTNTSKTDCMSVLIADIVRATGRKATDLTTEKKPYMVSLLAITVRSEPISQIIIESIPSSDVAHRDVYGKKSKTVREAMAKACSWEIEPHPDSN